ncbi:hypothetical protein JYG33_12390 [Alcaligenes sp. SORT26]|uniref:hypothetical protein n=1 Tax=Alcaligenes sp. SORT26 TaxID=2813780 RepID=UPI001A9D89E4|nr:hypothetical protein [Alcaligenes sp. SORT26]QTB98784.1 hypothetical protein JYG33_12390 [Alcaligenes sp. SORT26]
MVDQCGSPELIAQGISAPLSAKNIKIKAYEIQWLAVFLTKNSKKQAKAGSGFWRLGGFRQ